MLFPEIQTPTSVRIHHRPVNLHSYYPFRLPISLLRHKLIFIHNLLQHQLDVVNDPRVVFGKKLIKAAS